jgi:hypothetical protein
MRGFAAPGTPARYDKVGVIEVGPRSARNVLVLEPGTSAGVAYFVPLAQRIVSRLHGWQVWSVERRENLLEDQSVLEEAKRGRATAARMFDYYLGWLIPGATSGPHITLIPDGRVRFAKAWGMQVAVDDLHPPGGAAARSCWAAIRSAARSSPPTPRGASTAAPAPTISPASSTSTGAACRR